MSDVIQQIEGRHVVLGSGPVAQAVARVLSRAPSAQTVIASRRPTCAPEFLESGRVSLLQCDLLDQERLNAACDGARTVVFAAAPAYHRWPQEFPRLQAAATEAAARAEAVLVSAENLYGYGATERMTEASPLSASTRKGAVRAQMSADLFEAHRSGRVVATAARASDLFGEPMRMSALGERVWPALLAGRRIDWIGDPDAPHSFTWIDDYAALLVRLGSAPQAWGAAWHTPSPPDLSPREVLRRAADLAGAPTPNVRRLPKAALRLVGLFDKMAAEVVEMTYQFDGPFHMDWSAAHDAFGMEPASWDDALRATIAWWRREAAR